MYVKTCVLTLQARDREFILYVSYIEIYNEEVRDLLEPGAAPITIYENSDKSVVITASKKCVQSYDEISEV